MKRFLGLALLLIVTSANRSWAFEVSDRQKTGKAGQPGEWLTSFSASARDAGLANASTALTGSAAFYANPAGIVKRKTAEINLLVAPLYSSGQYQALSASYPNGERESFGIGMLYLTSGEAERTNNFGETIGSFEEKNMAFVMSYGRSLFGDFLDAGLNAKIVRHSLAEYSATSYGADLGLQARPFWDNARIGLAVQNILPPRLKLKDEKESFPLIMRTGLALAFEPFGRPLLISMDANMSPLFWRLGVEQSPVSLWDAPLFMRLGLNSREYTIGFGVGKNPLVIDYALSLHELELLHRIGITIRFAGEKRLEEEWEKIRRKEAELKEMQYALKAETRSLRKEKALEPKADRSRPVATTKPEDATLLVTKDRTQKESAEDQLSTAKGLYSGKQYEECIRVLEKALPLLPNNTEAEYFMSMCRAYVAIDAEEYERAHQHLVRAVELDPTSQEATLLYEKVKDIMEISGRGK